MMKIIQAETSEQVEQARVLFREYEAGLGLDLCFQGFEQELASLPGKYAPPQGCLLLAVEDEQILGCAAFRQINADTCEMKRLFVRETGRGRGLGKDLVEEIIKRARLAGYRSIRLDTLPSRMGKAIAIYRARGFREIPAYYETPVNETIFMELRLSDG